MASADFGIIGAGPAGLAAAYDLAKRGEGVTVFERDGQVGGLSKTVSYKGYRCDIGGHRFFTKSDEVNALWREVLGDDFLRRPRLSRIYYDRKLFSYPLKPLNALSGLGLWTSARAFVSYLRRKLAPHRPETGFDDWVSNRFGDVLFAIFFKTYTEKVWGISCREISADWAAQRIRNLNLGRAVLNALGIGKGRSVASLIDEFDYPRHGPGQMYEAMAERAGAAGAELQLNADVRAVRHDGRRITGLDVLREGGADTVSVSRVVSTMPLTELAARLVPAAPDDVLDAARRLGYRSILTVNLIVRKADVLPDTWIYVHEPDVRVGRLQFYKNWSPEMVPDPAMSVVGMEYFAFEGDELWSMPDADLLDLGKRELEVLGFVEPELVEDGFVVRYPKAYPVYDLGYLKRVTRLRTYLAQFENLVCAGRYGQFRYNNMDHSIMSALLGVRRLLGEDVDPWSVNAEAEYHEEKG